VQHTEKYREFLSLRYFFVAGLLFTARSEEAPVRAGKPRPREIIKLIRCGSALGCLRL